MAAPLIQDHLRDFNLDWFSKVLGVNVESIEWEKIESDGVVSNLSKVRVLKELPNQEGVKVEHLMLKQYLQDAMTDLNFFQNFGLAREAEFYNSVASLKNAKQRDALLEMIPKVYFAKGDSENGCKIVLMEDLSVSGLDPMRFTPLDHPSNVGKGDLVRETRSQVDFGRDFTYRLVEEVGRKALYYSLNL